MNVIMRFCRHILDLLFPRICIGCRAMDTVLCDKCLAVAPRAREAELPFIHAVFDYRDPVIKRALKCFKYKNMRCLAPIFAEHLFEEIIAELGDSIDAGGHEKYILIPVPLHTSRERERGYNQSELLARELLRLDTGTSFEYMPDILVRAKKTRQQARNERRSARRENLRDAFVCHDLFRVRGRTVILIDDITTTGTTLVEAKRALATGKPRAVLAFAIAH